MNYEGHSPHPSWSDLRPHPQRQPKSSFKHSQSETVLHFGQVLIERKTFVFQLRENSRGRLLRITEASATRQNCIIIPVPGIREFSDLISKMAETAAKLPIEK